MFYSNFLLRVGDIFQDPQYHPETMIVTNPVYATVFLCIHTMTNFNLQRDIQAVSGNKT